MDNNMMGGIFGGSLRNRQRPYSASPGPMPAPSSGRIMPTGGASMGVNPQPVDDGPQNRFMPQGSPAGPQMPFGGNTSMPQQEQPLTQAEYSPRAPVADPNQGYMLSALQGGLPPVQSPNTSVGTPQANTPGINMQNIPFFNNQLRNNANAPMMQYLSSGY